MRAGHRGSRGGIAGRRGKDSEGDVADVYITFVTPTQMQSVQLSRDPNDVSGRRWRGTAPIQWAWSEYFVQAVDEAGNVALAADKGQYLQVVPIQLYLPIVFRQ